MPNKPIYATFHFDKDGFHIKKLFSIYSWGRRGTSDEYEVLVDQKFYSEDEDDKFRKTFYPPRDNIYNNLNVFFDHIFFLGSRIK